MASPVAKITDELEARAAAFVKERRLPGASVGVVHGDDLVWSAGVGFSDVAARRARDASTLYRIASGPIDRVTIRRMLSHESGLASEPPGTDWSTPSYEGVVERNLERVGEIGTRIPPNVQQKYSNLAYQLLGEVVSRLTGTPYVEHVRSAILEPLGMSHTYFRSGPRAACGRASRTWRGGSRSSSARDRRCSQPPR